MRVLPSLLLFLLLVPALYAQEESGTPSTFGDSITIARSSAISVSQAVVGAVSNDRPVLVKGRVVDVCQKKGCWMILADSTTHLRVTFKDYAFFVPTDAEGEVLVQGLVREETISAEDSQHYAEESKNGNDIFTSEPQVVVSMEATGIEFPTRR